VLQIGELTEITLVDKLVIFVEGSLRELPQSDLVSRVSLFWNLSAYEYFLSIHNPANRSSCNDSEVFLFFIFVSDKNKLSILLF